MYDLMVESLRDFWTTITFVELALIVVIGLLACLVVGMHGGDDHVRR